MIAKYFFHKLKSRMMKINALLLIFVLNNKILFQFNFILASDATVPKAPGNPVPVHFTV